jgi:hypothetical protein
LSLCINYFTTNIILQRTFIVLLSTWRSCKYMTMIYIPYCAMFVDLIIDTYVFQYISFTFCVITYQMTCFISITILMTFIQLQIIICHNLYVTFVKTDSRTIMRYYLWCIYLAELSFHLFIFPLKDDITRWVK